MVFAALNVRRLLFFSVSAMLLIVPISNAAFMPRSVFGIAGVNVANVVWFFAFISVAISMHNKKGSLYLHKYLISPVFIFMFLYLLAAIWTFIDIKSIEAGTFDITRLSVLLEKIFKPIQFFIAGWIVMSACMFKDNKKNIQRVMYFIPLLLVPIQLYYFFMGGSVGDEYSGGRGLISTSIGYHANELGAVGTYLLAIILLVKEDSWQLIRYFAIGATLIIIAVSFSRMAYITTIMLFAFTFSKFTKKEKTALISMVAIVVLVFSAQLINRINFGVNDNSTKADINSISANRIDGIWSPLFPHIVYNIVVGSGVYGLLKAGPVSRSMPTHPHNAYMQVVLDMGVVGLIVLFWMLIRFFKIDKRPDNAFKYLIICWMMMGLTGHSFYPIFANFLVWVGYGFVLAGQQDKSMKDAESVKNISTAMNNTRILYMKSKNES